MTAKSYQMKKVMIKVIHKDQFMWRHFCRIDKDLFYHFFEVMKIERSAIADFVEKWALIDFNIHLKMTRQRDIGVLKQLVMERSKKQYPNLYIESPSYKIDSQGWLRMWVTRHMKEELRAKGEIVD